MDAVFTRPFRYTGTSNPNELTYPNANAKHKGKVIGVKIINESINYDLFLLDVKTHGPKAKENAIRIPAGKWQYFGAYPDCKPVGMCYEIQYAIVPEGCQLKDCEEVAITKEMGMMIIEEYIKTC